MIRTGLLIIGAGPAGLSAAVSAGAAGVPVMLLERSHVPGGQLVKQTHMFFGSEKQHAAERGFDIADILLAGLNLPNVKIYLESTALAIYDDGVVSAEIDGKYIKILPEAILIATGASEKSLLFENNDLPGIYGAGAVQTLMNQYGVLPARSAVMLGAGNIGLIVGYQLMQAGVEVKAVIEGSPKIGGYLVHASKLCRMGVSILTSHTIKTAHGKDRLEAVSIWQLDNNWQGIAGTEQVIETDALCVSVGLSPLVELLWQAGCEMKYIASLGGYVPLRDENMRTSISNIYIAGDVTGVEEATSAMVEGTLAGLSASIDLGYKVQDYDIKRADCIAQLEDLRRGQAGEKIREGITQAIIK